MNRFSYADRTTFRVSILAILAIISIPYYFIAGGTLLGFIITRLIGHVICYFSPIGHHRWLSHRYFEPTKTGKILMCFSMVASGIGNPLQIVTGHRIHHAHSDTEKDIHSPKHLTFWQMILGRFREPTVVKLPKDYFRDPWAMFLHNHYWKLFILLNVLIFLVFDLKTMLIFCPINFIYGWILTNIGVNYYGHYDYKTKEIKHRNVNRLVTFLTAGETLQGNHHEYPNRVNFSTPERKDPAFWLVKLLSKDKLA